MEKKKRKEWARSYAWSAPSLLLIGLFFGFRYRFSGPELERDSINDVMENVASTAADMGRQVMDELHLQYEKRTRDRDGKE